ncbi:MAG: AAA family ATPase [Gemmatimonadetes bacterium]|nr:AAA family ATPase [Gemmatimonadota bacterium]
MHRLLDLQQRPELLAPPRAVIPGIAYAGRVTLLAAPRKSGKSTLLGGAVAALSAGRAFLGEPLDQAETLWLALDEPLGDLVRRLGAEEADGRSILIAEPPMTPARAIVAASEHAPALLVIDTLSDLLASSVESENDAASNKRALAPIRELARSENIAVVLCHHTTKATGRSRGSGAFEDMADLILHLAVDAEDPTVRRVAVEGRVPASDFAFRWGLNGFELADDEAPLITRVRQAVWARPGLSQRELRTLVTGSAAEISVAMKRLLASGEVVNVGESGRHSYRLVENRSEPPQNRPPETRGTA